MERCGALPHAPAGEGALTRPGERRTENGEQRTRDKRATKQSLCRETKLPSIQASKLPTAPAPAARPVDVPDRRPGRAGRHKRYRSAHAGRWKGAVQSGESRRPICPIRPICPTAASKTASVGNRRLRRTQRPQRRQRGTETGGVLAHAGLPVCLGITKDTKDQGALTRPGEQSVQAQRAKPSTKGARPARRAWRGMAGFARHALGRRVPERSLSRDSQKRKGWG